MTEEVAQQSLRLNPKNIQLNEEQQNDNIQPIKSRQKPQHKDKAKKKRHLLSFNDEIQQEGQQKIAKNHNKNTLDLTKIKNKTTIQQQLKDQYLKDCERIKEQLFEVEYSYWEGGDIIKKLRRMKKQTIKQLLQICRLDLIQNYQQLAKISASDLLFVIKDFIAPHQMAIFQIQALQMKTTKNDLLFEFKNVIIKKDKKDTTLSVNFGGPIRIVEKSRYEKNKTMFPFCNWQTFSIK